MTRRFDLTPDRTHSDSLKWQRYAGRDVIPLWVADMDFASPPAVTEALRRRADHGVFGYALPSDELVQAIVRHVETRFQWTIEPEWLVFLPGLVTGLNVACRAVGQPGDAVLTTTPVYPPFLSAPSNMERRLITVPLSHAQNRWEWDFDALERAVTPETRLFLLCSPHNPTGRLWRRDELDAVAEFCLRHDLVLCSDEIHADLVLTTATRHVCTASLNEETARRTITLMAPSKTFNVPGLGCAYAIIPNPELRDRFNRAAAGIVPHVNLMGYVAAQAAYTQGGEWLEALLETLRQNRDRVQAAVDTLPGLAMTEVEATYLAWIDARGLGVDDPVAFFEQAGVGLSDGSEFGAPGFVRLNFGCAPSLLQKALDRMAEAVSKQKRG